VTIQRDHFSLFGLPARFALDAAALDAAYKRVQSQVHPDRFAAATAAEKRVAMQWAARANEAFETLKSPLRRAAYLCEMNGVPIGAESNTAMPAAFLVQQLEWREQLEAARAAGDTAQLRALDEDVRAMRAATLAQLARAIDEARDFAAAAALVRQLMFIEKFESEVGGALAVAAADAG
jgi:molecular chaperone HscB